MGEQINRTKIADRYNNLDVIIDEDDLWHLNTKHRITRFISKINKELSQEKSLTILNAGSAGFSYGLSENNIFHVDLAEKHISGLTNAIVADIENMPIEDCYFDGIICVGSVLNYCDPISVFQEFKRVLKPQGFIILEFECSRTFELLFKKEFNKDVVFIETFFDVHGDKENIWYFSETYITNLIKTFGFKINAVERFHIISPLIFRITNKINFSSKFCKYDKALSYIPYINRFCSNVMYEITI